MSPLAFTVLSHEHYVTSEGGALLTSTEYPADRPALCRERVMNSGQSCPEVIMVRATNMLIGVGRPTLDPNAIQAYNTAGFWGIYSNNGQLYHGATGKIWQGMEGYGEGDALRLLLDSDAGTLTIKKNGTLLCWAWQ